MVFYILDKIHTWVQKNDDNNDDNNNNDNNNNNYNNNVSYYEECHTQFMMLLTMLNLTQKRSYVQTWLS